MTRAKPENDSGRIAETMPPLHGLRTAQIVGRSFRHGIHAVQTGDSTAWAFAWQELAAAGAAGNLAQLSDGLAGFVHEVRHSAARPIEVLPRGCPGLCRDECLAVSLVAASQTGACPALKACAFALLECSNLEPCLKAAAQFGGALREAGHTLPPDMICNALAFLPAALGRPVAHA